MENKNLVLVVVGLGLFLGLVLFVNNFLVPKITKNVIQELRREYTPGPYDPGFDPDKVSPNSFRSEVSETQISN